MITCFLAKDIMIRQALSLDRYRNKRLFDHSDHLGGGELLIESHRRLGVLRFDETGEKYTLNWFGTGSSFGHAASFVRTAIAERVYVID